MSKWSLYKASSKGGYLFSMFEQVCKASEHMCAQTGQEPELYYWFVQIQYLFNLLQLILEQHPVYIRHTAMELIVSLHYNLQKENYHEQLVGSACRE